MRFILRYRYGFFQKKSERVDVTHCLTTDDLIAFIQKKVSKQHSDFIIRSKCDKMSYRIVKGWSMSVYELKDGAELQLQFIERDESESKGKYSNSKYLMNVLGNQKQQLNKIDEQQEQEDEQQDDQPRKTRFNIRKYLDMECEKILKLVQKGKWLNIVKIVDELPDDADQDDILEIQRMKRKILNELGEGGWGAIHYAVFCNKPEIVNELLKREVDVNKCTTDGWLPLQLAINRKNFDILRILLYEPTIRVNETTSKGTALHVAAKLKCLEGMQALLKAGADPKNIDDKSKNCIQVCTSEQAVALINKYEEQKQKTEENKAQQTYQIAILKGIVNRIKAVFHTLAQKYLVLDPYQGTLIRYEDEAGYPKRPKQTIPLSEIVQESIKLIQDRSWHMKKEFTYFEFNHPKKTLLAVKNQAIAEKWISGIQSALKYQKQISQNNNTIVISQENKIIFQLDDKNNKIVSLNKNKQANHHLHRPPPIQIPKTNIFNIKSVKNSMQDSDSGSMSPLMPNKSIAMSSRPSEKGISFAEDPSPKAKDISEEVENQSSQATDISIKIQERDNVKEEIKAANKQLSNQLNSIMSEKVNFASFEVLQTLGSGAFGKVFLARHIRSGINYALKALKKKTLIMKKQLKYAITEAKVLKQANHPFIINLHYAFQTPNFLYLALDYCPGKDLSFHLARETTFGQDESRVYMAELLLAIDHLHSKSILYRDLKPENILLDGDGHIKLADFGLSKDNVEDKSKSFCGSPAYLSPEMLNQKGVGKESDIYGVGCVLYECLVGEPPYYSDDMPTLFENIRQGKLKYPKHVTDDARSLISGLLQRDPKKRLGSKGIEQIKKHPWFSKINWNVAANRGLKPPVRDFKPEDEDSDEEIALTKKVQSLITKANFTDFDYEDDSKRINRLNDFSFVRTID